MGETRIPRSNSVPQYGWLSPGDPDPAGKRLEVVRAALKANPHIEGFFWDYASLYQASSFLSLPFPPSHHPCCLTFVIRCQKPPGGKRTTDEQEAFDRALKVMADVYASAVGTTVLQLKEIPPRPKEFDGALCLWDLKPDVDEASIRAALGGFGKISSCELEGNPVIVRFATHEAALSARMAMPAWTQLCGGVCTLYNERSYDGRREDGRDDDGRGW